MSATVTFEYKVTTDGGKTWQPRRKVFTGIREPHVDSTPGELHKVMFYAEECVES